MVTRVKPQKSKTRELRAWLREIGATHVLVEGPDMNPRRVKVSYACTLARGCQPTEVRVHRAQQTGVMWKGGDDGFVRMVIHSPTVRTADGWDEHGREVFVDEPIREAS